METTPPRDPTTNELRGDRKRFPAGMKALGDYIHGKGLKYAQYTAESPTTCEGYPASAGHEGLDAMVFASWGVDYLKVDGCGSPAYYPIGYPAMGIALANTSRPIEYSCSWQVTPTPPNAANPTGIPLNYVLSHLLNQVLCQ